MNRREFLQCAAILVNGLAISQAGFALSQEQKHFISRSDYIAEPSAYFSESQKQLIAAMAETIIPRTDTPGAIDAGVPRFIELMVSDWMTDQERELFMSGLKEMKSAIPAEHGKPFDQLSPGLQLSILEHMEDAASDSDWYSLANGPRGYISDAPFFCHLKELTIWGFFTSEVGSTQVLRSNPMPMTFDGDVKLSPDDSTWAPFNIYSME
jgi:gluconate 2-dehydrogenase gamma chain